MAYFAKKRRAWLRKSLIGIPYLWSVLFFIIPCLIVFKISFSEAQLAIPPYTDMIQFAQDRLQVVVSFANYIFLSEESLYYAAYLGSVKMALITTLCCLALGYPMAYRIAQSPMRTRTFLLLLVLLPSWTSFLIRIYAWIGILKNQGFLNAILLHMGLIEHPLILLNTNIAVYIGMVYAYLPFMVLPIYANLSKHDPKLLEASADLGAKPWKSWFTITLPLSKSGIIAGCMLVFIPSVGEFVVPELLGGSHTLMIGKVLWQEFFNNRDWPMASALAVIMLLLLCLPMFLLHDYQSKNEPLP